MELGASAPKWRAPKVKTMVNDIVYTATKVVENYLCFAKKDRTAVWPPFRSAPNTRLLSFCHIIF